MSEICFSDELVFIPISTGELAIVDRNIFTRNALFAFPWTTQRNAYTSYAIRFSSCGDGSRVKFYMHRLVLGVSHEVDVDHINGNGLDNRLKNLRICTKSQNGFNRSAKKGKRFKGVFYRPGRKKPWLAAMFSNRRQFHIGYFFTEEEAAVAYDCEAIRRHGDFAKLNIQRDGPVCLNCDQNDGGGGDIPCATGT